MQAGNENELATAAGASLALSEAGAGLSTDLAGKYLIHFDFAVLVYVQEYRSLISKTREEQDSETHLVDRTELLGLVEMLSTLLVSDTVSEFRILVLRAALVSMLPNGPH